MHEREGEMLGHTIESQELMAICDRHASIGLDHSAAYRNLQELTARHFIQAVPQSRSFFADFSARDCGYAINKEENEIGVFRVVVPVFDVEKVSDAMLSATGLNRHFGNQERNVRMFRQAPSEISVSLGVSATRFKEKSRW